MKRNFWKVIVGVFVTAIFLFGTKGGNVSVQANYEVIMPEQSLLRTENLEAYSQKIRDLNREEIENLNLPAVEKQDAIRNVLQVIAELHQDEIDQITRIKEGESKLESSGRCISDNNGNCLPTAKWDYYGDILITLEANGKWNLGHAGLVDYYVNTVVEAPGEGKNVGRYANYKTYYAKRNTDELYVRGATQEKYKKALNFAISQVGKPYNLNTTLSANDKWYCSKLVYRAWLEAGYDLSASYVTINGLKMITPEGILWDNDVAWLRKVK